jgi:hypothetical protein
VPHFTVADFVASRAYCRACEHAPRIKFAVLTVTFGGHERDRRQAAGWTGLNKLICPESCLADANGFASCQDIFVWIFAVERAGMAGLAEAWP